MAWPSPPLTFICSRGCGWKKTHPFPVSDCRVEGVTHFAQCPRCGAAVKARRATPLDLLVARIG